MTEKKYVADYKRMSVFMASAGTGGDLMYKTTGSAVAGLNAGMFFGILDTTTVAGSYGMVDTRGVFNITKGDGSSQKIEQGDVLYGSGATSVATAQVSTGSVIGVAWEQSSSDNANVAVVITGNNDILL